SLSYYHHLGGWLPALRLQPALGFLGGRSLPGPPLLQSCPALISAGECPLYARAIVILIHVRVGIVRQPHIYCICSGRQLCRTSLLDPIPAFLTHGRCFSSRSGACGRSSPSPALET